MAPASRFVTAAEARRLAGELLKDARYVLIHDPDPKWPRHAWRVAYDPEGELRGKVYDRTKLP